MNIVWGLLLVLMSFITLLLAYRFFGKAGIFAWIALATVLSNIQVVKNIEILGVTATLGNVLYGSVFLATDLLSEYYSDRDARDSVYLGLGSSVIMIIAMQLAIVFIPAESDIATPAFQAIFNPAVRIVAGSLVAYFVSQLLDIYLFRKIKEKFPGDKFLWLRNNGATCASQLIDTAIFISISFIGVYPTEVLIQIYLTSYIFKVIVALLDTPFIYLSKKIKPRVEK